MRLNAFLHYLKKKRKEKEIPEKIEKLSNMLSSPVFKNSGATVEDIMANLHIAEQEVLRLLGELETVYGRVEKRDDKWYWRI
ncbi:MAG: hypothetical protein ACETVN_04125 [Asgard group archaeon]